MIAKVIVDISNSEVDKIFDYIIPSDFELEVGTRVLVPFGNRSIEGFCITLNRFYREPVFSDKDARVTIKGFNLEKLMEAYAKVLFNYTKEEEIIDVKKIERDEYTVARQLRYLVDELIEKKEISFFSIFDEVVTRSEIINTFLALLQLVSKQFACIMQEDADSDIMIGINSECDPEVFDYTILAMASEEDNFDGQSDTNS